MMGMVMANLKFSFFLFATVIVSAWALPGFAQPGDDDVLWSSPEFDVTVRDLKWYMKSPVNADGEYLWEHPQKVQRAIIDLMTLRVLEVEADKADVMSEEEKQWLASYRVAMAAVSRHVREQAMGMMESVDWEQAAREYYLAHRDEFVTPEARTVRALLLRLSSRTEDEALALATGLAPKTLSQDDFRSVVLDNTEDAAAGDGLLEGLTVGQTVQPFEDVVFALSSIGEISDPFVSQFGVHVAQLLAISPSRQQTFDEVVDQITEEVKQKRWQEFNNYLRGEPERNPPPDVVEMTDNVDALLDFANTRHRAFQEEQIRAIEESLP
jgi:hypothetical protein